MFTNDIKKGMRFVLRNGWPGTMQDNKKGAIRTATIEGHYTETGSIYAHDIAYVVFADRDELVELTDKQIKLMKQLKSMGWN